MDLKRMRYFCTIAEAGQISRAARLLHMAQPPLSQRLRELEEELETPLFLRKGRELQLTEAGQLFYRRARDILRAVDASKEELIRAASQTMPSVRIGLSPTCRSLWLSRFERLRALLPERQIGLVVGDSSYLEQLLQAGQIDLACMLPPLHPEDFVIHPLATSRSVAVVPRALLDPAATSVTLADLSRQPLLLLRRTVGVGSYERLLRSLHEAGLTAHVALYSSDVELLIDLLKRGFKGIAVVPEAETGGVGADFCVLPVAVDLPDYRVSLVCRKIGADAALIERVLQSWRD